MQTYSIGELARAAEVPTSTVRFYERAGLLKPAARSGANYRLYSEQSLERLQFIRSARAVGLSLDDVAGMVDAAHGAEPCAAVVALVERRLAEVREKLKHLKTVERTLAKAVVNCCTDADGLCNRVTHLRKICQPA
jgi:MerR family mercuric resistance operon transcriptional regulator